MRYRYTGTEPAVLQVVLPHAPDELPRLLEVEPGGVYEISLEQFPHTPQGTVQVPDPIIPPELQPIEEEPHQ